MPSIGSCKVSGLLEDNIFVIPSYQRLYSWSALEADDLINDIINVADHQESLHFFGNIITIKTDSQSYKLLIDGQQRITTSIVLLAIIRDFAKSLINQLPSNQQNIHNQYVQQLQYIEHEINKILFSNKQNHSSQYLSLDIHNVHGHDQVNYKKLFNGMVIDDGEHTFSKYVDRQYGPSRLLNIVHRRLRSRLRQELRKYNDIKHKVEVLNKIFQAFVDQFYVITMTANSSSEALVIYITLNTRGKELSAPDIIKAYLAGIINQNHHNVTNIMNKWDNITNTLNGEDDTITTFLQLYWLTLHQKVATRKLSRCVVKDVTTSKKVCAMINDLTQLAPVYKKLRNPFSEDINKLNGQTHRIDMMNQMGLRYYYPIIFSLYHRQYKKSEINEAFNLILKIEMREAINQGSHPGYQLPANYIWSTTRNIKNALKGLSNKLDNDSKTYSILTTYQRRISESGTGKTFKLMSYIIAKIYNYKNNDFSDPDAIYNDLFKNHKYALIHFDTKDLNYINYLGNCALIEKKLVTKLTNNNLVTIVNKLKASHLKGNNILANSIKLHQEDLENFVIKRQDNLAKLFIKIW